MEEEEDGRPGEEEEGRKVAGPWPAGQPFHSKQCRACMRPCLVLASPTIVGWACPDPGQARAGRAADPEYGRGPFGRVCLAVTRERPLQAVALKYIWTH